MAFTSLFSPGQISSVCKAIDLCRKEWTGRVLCPVAMFSNVCWWRKWFSWEVLAALSACDSFSWAKEQTNLEEGAGAFVASWIESSDCPEIGCSWAWALWVTVHLIVHLEYKRVSSEEQNDVGRVAEAMGLCFTTCISKDPKQESSENLGTESRTAQLSA